MDRRSIFVFFVFDVLPNFFLFSFFLKKSALLGGLSDREA